LIRDDESSPNNSLYSYTHTDTDRHRQTDRHTDRQRDIERDTCSDVEETE